VIIANLKSKKDMPNKPLSLENRLIDFSILIINICESLPTNYAAKHLGNQMLRSGTSPALNYGEAQRAESKKDFIHKMKICLKELHETSVILKILSKKEYNPKDKVLLTLKENRELIAIFVSSIKTAQKTLTS
jgi:four helix bundle protein